jgi:DNA repair exonuclease SbcCD ATPase subunit
MEMSKFFKAFTGLLNRVDKVETGYMKALEQKEQQLLELNTLLAEKNAVLKDIHRSVILGEVSESTYQDHKAEVDNLRKQITELSQEMQYIEAYKREDVEALLDELDKAKSQYSREQREEIDKLKYELHQKKLEYLEAMVSAKKRYDEIVNPVRTLEALKIRLGKQQNAYASGSFEELIQISDGKGGTATLDVPRTDIFNALSYGRLPSGAVQIVENGKKAGRIQ